MNRAWPIHDEDRTVYKYPLVLSDDVQFDVPSTATILYVGEQAGRLTVWADVRKHHARHANATDGIPLVVTGTGNPVPDSGRHVGSVQMPNGAVWHVWRVSSWTVSE